MMPAYILDTDTISLLVEGREPISSRVLAAPSAELFVTVITLEEALTGWYTLIRKARTPAQVEFAYGQLALTTLHFARYHVLNYTQRAIARFDQLRKLKLNVGPMDLRIAAIALEEVGAVVVTRNVRDFGRVPNLAVEDWTQSITS